MANDDIQNINDVADDVTLPDEDTAVGEEILDAETLELDTEREVSSKEDNPLLKAEEDALKEDEFDTLPGLGDEQSDPGYFDPEAWPAEEVERGAREGEDDLDEFGFHLEEESDDPSLYDDTF